MSVVVRLAINPRGFNRLLPLIDPTVISMYLDSTSAVGARNTQCLSNPNRNTASPYPDAGQLLEWLMVAHYVFPRTLFSLAVIILSPKWILLLRFSKES